MNLPPTIPMAEVIRRTAAYVGEKFQHDSSGHDWHHVERVWRMARWLAEAERADRDIVELAALLHDLEDWKFAGGDESAGPRAAAEWLNQFSLPPGTVRQIGEIIRDLSFKGAHVATPMRSLEGQIVQDADRLDAIGAIGIARAFAYGGHRGRLLYDPAVPPQLHASFAEYKRNSGPTINHFYEKLLLLRDRMNTEAARQIAEQRHAVMEAFLRQFFAEWHFPERDPSQH